VCWGYHCHTGIKDLASLRETADERAPPPVEQPRILPL